MPTDLSARIKMINLQNKMAKAHHTEEQEQESENSLIDTVEQIWEEQQEEETAVPNYPVIALDDIFNELKAIREVMAEHTETLKKINKHINATQKAMKKGAK